MEREQQVVKEEWLERLERVELCQELREDLEAWLMQQHPDDRLLFVEFLELFEPDDRLKWLKRWRVWQMWQEREQWRGQQNPQ